MGVYIKGMEMPKPKLADMATIYNAYILVDPNGRAAIVVDNEDGLDSTEYSLVTVPPHGRLIDADALMEYIKNALGCYGNEYQIKTTFGALLDYIKARINDAPTIIPASEEGSE